MRAREQKARCASMPIRSSAAATIALNGPVGTGNTRSTMIAAVIKVGRRSAPGGELAPESASRLSFKSLVDLTGNGALVDLLRIKLGFPNEVFERVVGPVIEGYAEFAQLLPVPQSEHPAGPGSLFTRGLELGSRALDYRRGQILP